MVHLTNLPREKAQDVVVLVLGGIRREVRAHRGLLVLHVGGVGAHRHAVEVVVGTHLSSSYLGRSLSYHLQADQLIVAHNYSGDKSVVYCVHIIKYFMEGGYTQQQMISGIISVVALIIAYVIWQRAQGKADVSKKFKGKGSTPTLGSFSRDVTALAKEGKVDPVIGREKEIKRVIQILSRRSKNNPVLIGEPGVGKTAIVEGLAYKIDANDVPEILQGKRVLQLDVPELMSGTKYRGEFEQRAKRLVNEIQKSERNIILFIDEIHVVMQSRGTEGSINFSDILKPALARGELQLVGATTLKEYDQYFKIDEALERRFQPVIVDEPSVEDAIVIMQGIKKNYEEYHNVKYTDEAVRSSVTLSKEYIKDRLLPDKAIDVIDEAAAMVKVARGSNPDSAIGLLHGAAKEAKEKHFGDDKELQKLHGELVTISKKEQGAKGKKALETLRAKKLEVVAKIESKQQTIAKEKGDLIVDIGDIKQVVADWSGHKIEDIH